MFAGNDRDQREKRNAARISNEPPARIFILSITRRVCVTFLAKTTAHTHTQKFYECRSGMDGSSKGGRDPFGRVTKGQSIKIHWPSISRSQWVEKKRNGGPFITRTFHFVCLLNRRAIDFVSLFLFLPIRLKRTTTTIFPHRFLKMIYIKRAAAFHPIFFWKKKRLFRRKENYHKAIHQERRLRS